MLQDGVASRREDGSVLLGVRLPFKQMRFDVQSAVWPRTFHVDADEVATRPPAGFISIRVDRTSGETNVIGLLRHALPVLVAKQMNRGTPAYVIMDVVLVHEPIGRVMAQHEVDDVVHGIQHRLERTEIEVPFVVLTIGPG